MSPPGECYKGVSKAVSIVSAEIPLVLNRPLASIEIREPCIALEHRIDTRQVDPISAGPDLPVEIGTSDNHYLQGITGGPDSLVERGDHDATLRHVIFVPGNNDVDPARKWLANGLPGFSAHDYRFAQRGLFEMPQIGGQVPGQAAGAADQAVAVHRHDDREGRSHDQTAIGAAI